MFDDFKLDNTASGILPKHAGIPTDLKNSRRFFGIGGPLPRFYYDFEAQKRHYAHRRLGARIKD